MCVALTWCLPSSSQEDDVDDAHTETLRCKHCNGAFVKIELADHEAGCSWKRVKCRKCGRTSTRRDIKRHEAKCKGGSDGGDGSSRRGRSSRRDKDRDRERRRKRRSREASERIETSKTVEGFDRHSGPIAIHMTLSRALMKPRRPIPRMAEQWEVMHTHFEEGGGDLELLLARADTVTNGGSYHGTFRVHLVVSVVFGNSLHNPPHSLFFFGGIVCAFCIGTIAFAHSRFSPLHLPNTKTLLILTLYSFIR